jgi:hypothetical protein
VRNYTDDWDEVEGVLCPECGRPDLVAGDWACPRCSGIGDDCDELWQELEAPRRKAQAFIEWWLNF